VTSVQRSYEWKQGFVVALARPDDLAKHVAMYGLEKMRGAVCVDGEAPRGRCGWGSKGTVLCLQGDDGRCGFLVRGMDLGLAR
jgi:hypothetical protein